MEEERENAAAETGAGEVRAEGPREEILPALLAYTAKTVEEKLAGALRAGGGRPGENGAGGQSAAAPRLDARRMDRAEFQALCRKIAAGERVSMG